MIVDCTGNYLTPLLGPDPRRAGPCDTKRSGRAETPRLASLGFATR